MSNKRTSTKETLATMTQSFVENMSARIDDEEHMLAHAKQYKTIALTLEKLAHVVSNLEDVPDAPEQEPVVQEQIPQKTYSSEREFYKDMKENISSGIDYLVDKLALQELHDEGITSQVSGNLPEAIDSS